jgi:hypothetical protein
MEIALNISITYYFIYITLTFFHKDVDHDFKVCSSHLLKEKKNMTGECILYSLIIFSLKKQIDEA